MNEISPLQPYYGPNYQNNNSSSTTVAQSRSYRLNFNPNNILPSSPKEDSSFISNAFSYLEALGNYSKDAAKYSTSRLGSFISKFAKPVQFITGGISAVDSYKSDIQANDPYYTNTTVTAGGIIGNLVLGTVAGMTITGLGIAAAPAIALSVGAGLTGAAIGEDLGQAVVDTRKYFGW